MQPYTELMILPADKRRDYFRKAYAIELGRLHAKGTCVWPIERLPELVERVMTELSKGRAPIGPAYDETCKFFKLPSKRAVLTFLDYA